MEENAKARAAMARTKAQNDPVVGKGKGKAAAVTGESSKSAKEVIYDLLLRIFAYFNGIYRSLLWCIGALCGRPENRGRL